MLESEPGAHLANVATALLLEAAVALCRGDAAAAEVAAQRALGIRKQAHGAGSKEAAAAMGTLSDALRELGRLTSFSFVTAQNLRPCACRHACHH